MFAEIYDLERDPPAKPTPPLPIPEDLTPNDLMRAGHQPPAHRHRRRRPGCGVRGGIRGRAGRFWNRRPRCSGIVGYALSGMRVINRAAEPSPLLRRRSLATRTEAIDIPLSDLHRAAKAGGGSINDAYLAGLCGALRRYHEALGVPISTLPMAVPVNLRAEADTAGGNRFTGVNLAAPVGTVDPVSRMKKIRAQMTQRRDEPAMNIIGSVAPVLSVLPTAVLEGITGSVIGSDVQASNVPVVPGRHLHRRRKGVAAVRYRPTARRGDDGGADLAGRVVHHHRALRQGVGAQRAAVRPVPAGGFRRDPGAGR